MLDNFYNIVGFTPKDCTCIDEDRPVGYDTSYSSYYLDEAEHGIPLVVPQTECGDRSFWDILTRSRDEAINDFLLHFGNKLNEATNEKINNRAVNFGKRDFSKLESGDAFRGLRISPLIFRGATLVISSLQFYADASESLVFTVSPEIGTDQTFNFDVVPGWNQILSTPLRLPLSSNGEAIKYTIYHDSAEDAINNVIYCASCSGKKINYNGLFDIQGVSGEDAATVKTTEIYKNKAHGMIIDARIECDALTWLCNVENDFYLYNPYGRNVAKVLQMLWAVKTISQVLNSTSINFYTNLSREALYGKRNMLNKISKDMITMLASELPESLNHCYICKPAFGFSKRSL